MEAVVRPIERESGGVRQADVRLLRGVLVLQVGLGLLWGISMLFFASTKIGRAHV